MNVGYITTYDPNDINKWSGLGVHMRNALTQSGATVQNVGPLEFREPIYVRARRLLHTRIRGKGYEPDRDPAVVRNFSRQVDARLARMKVDVALSPGALAIAFCKTETPLALWADATFAGLLELYPGFARMSAASINNGHTVERAAIHRCSLLIYASEWAARSAIERYAADRKKIRVIPFGANLERKSTLIDVMERINARPRRPCRLVFLGADWQRKGGPLAVAVTRKLNQRNIPTQLHVIGCNPSIGGEDLPYVVIHGFIDKSTQNGAVAIETILDSSHFMILPARGECFGIAFAEASSCGVPSLATRAGGIPSAVRDGQNGKLFGLDATAEDYAHFIGNMMADPEAYLKLALSSFAEFEQRMNWRTIGATLYRLLESIKKK